MRSTSRRLRRAAASGSTRRPNPARVVFLATLVAAAVIGACRDPNAADDDRRAASQPVPVRPQPSNLVSSWPRDGTLDLTTSEWLQLEFAAPPEPALIESFFLFCGEQAVEFAVHRVRPTFYVVNPVGELPAGIRCALDWDEAGVIRRLGFATAAPGPAAHVEFDRETPGLAPPLPDDHYLEVDAASATGLRFSRARMAGDRPLDTFGALLSSDLAKRDGWSPLGSIQIALSDPVDLSSLPDSAAESVHPAASLQLIDIDPRSPEFGRRRAYHAEARDDPAPDAGRDHSLIIHPLRPLRPGGRYAVIATRSLRAAPGRPFDASPFLSRVFAWPQPGESQAVKRARANLRSTLWLAENALSPPIPREDMALAVSFTVGRLDDVGDDLAHIRRQLGVRPPSRFEIDRIEAMKDPEDVLEAVVHGTWFAPRWTRGSHVARDAGGRPIIEGTAPVPFTLALPRMRPVVGAPIVIYQHGNPGSAAAEVPVEARRGLAEAGFAVVGFTDPFNRERAQGATEADLAILMQWVKDFASLRVVGRLPERWLQTHAEQLAFVRFVQELSALDLLPVAGPDGIPDLDVDAPLGYLGMSEGANHAPAFLAFAPEVAAAVLIAGGAPIAGALMHQLDGSPGQAFAQRALGGHGRDLWSALVMLQTAIDPQDPQNHAPLLYRRPVEVSGTTRKASLLLLAGLYDRRVPNRMTDALAWSIGPLPMLAPVTLGVPFLRVRTGPIQANLTPTATGAYHRVVPFGVVGAGRPADCRLQAFAAWPARSGHFCAQLAPSAVAERVAFFRSALSGGPPVIRNAIDLDSSVSQEEPSAPQQEPSAPQQEPSAPQQEPSARQ